MHIILKWRLVNNEVYSCILYSLFSLEILPFYRMSGVFFTKKIIFSIVFSSVQRLSFLILGQVTRTLKNVRLLASARSQISFLIHS